MAIPQPMVTLLAPAPGDQLQDGGGASPGTPSNGSLGAGSPANPAPSSVVLQPSNPRDVNAGGEQSLNPLDAIPGAAVAGASASPAPAVIQIAGVSLDLGTIALVGGAALAIWYLHGKKA